MKSFIPWIGGKSLLAKKIVSLFPDNIQRYIEVFGGGGSVLFYGNQHELHWKFTMTGIGIWSIYSAVRSITAENFRKKLMAMSMQGNGLMIYRNR